jgi:hypothetical protein
VGPISGGVAISGVRFLPASELGIVSFQTSTDEGRTWRQLGQASVSGPPLTQTEVKWNTTRIDNIRVIVGHAPNPYFPFGDYFTALDLEADVSAWPTVLPPEFKPLKSSVIVPGFHPVAGDHDLRIHEHNGLCHRPPRTNRVAVTSDSEVVKMQSPLMNIVFSR